GRSGAAGGRPGEVVGCGPASSLLAATAEQRHHVDLAGYDEGADPRRAADLVRRQCDEVGPDRSRIEGKLAGRLDRVAMEQRPVSPSNRGDIGDRLDDAGLVV